MRRLLATIGGGILGSLVGATVLATTGRTRYDYGHAVQITTRNVAIAQSTVLMRSSIAHTAEAEALEREAAITTNTARWGDADEANRQHAEALRALASAEAIAAAHLRRHAETV